MVNHLVERSDYFCLFLYLLLELIQTLQDLLDIDVHIVDVFPVMISSHPDLVDLVVMGLQDATHLLKGRSRILLQPVPLWY